MEDWEMDDYVPLIPSEETKKRLEERKKQEESDLSISKELFGVSEPETLKLPEISVKVKPKTKISKKAENEMKLKEISKIIKDKKAVKSMHDEVFGECDPGDYEYYDYYEDKYDKS